MEEQNEILAAIRKLEQRFDGVDGRFDGIDKRFDGIDKRFDGIDQRFDGIDKRFDKLEGEVDRLHQSQIKLEDMRGDVDFISENVADLVKRFAIWEKGDEHEPSIPTRVSALELRVTRLETKKGRN